MSELLYDEETGVVYDPSAPPEQEDESPEGPILSTAQIDAALVLARHKVGRVFPEPESPQQRKQQRRFVRALFRALLQELQP